MRIYYYDQKGKRVNVKSFTNVSDIFHWCEMNCNRIGGNYYIGSNRILCEYKEQGK